MTDQSSTPIQVALIGYGTMGRRIDVLSTDYNADVKIRLDDSNNLKGEGFKLDEIKQAEVAIDFSLAEAVKINLPLALKQGLPVVIGTTGWIDDPVDVEELVKKHNGKVLYGSNFSLGVQLFIKLVRRAGELFGDSDLFDSVLHEVHHTRKADAPSGTAETMARQFLDGSQSTKEISYGVPAEGRVESDHFYVTAQRLGSVFGEHQLRINSHFDDIELTHRARSRDAFAAGALKAAHWLVKQDPGFYLLEDVVDQIV